MNTLRQAGCPSTPGLIGTVLAVKKETTNIYYNNFYDKYLEFCKTTVFTKNNIYSFWYV